MKQFLTTLLFCCLTFLSFGQQSTIDSLQQLLPNTTQADEQISIYYQLAAASVKINPPQAIQYSYQVHALLDNKPSKLQAKIYRVRAMATLYNGQPLQAQAILDSAILLLPPTSNSYLDTINDSMGEIYYRLAVGFIQKEPQKTIEYTNKIVHIPPQSKYQQLSVAYNVKAGAYHALAQYDSAVFFLDSSLHYIQQVKNTIFKQSETATIYSN